MFQPDDLTPALIALPYVTRVAGKVVKGSFRSFLMGGRPRYCQWFPYFCNS